MKSMNVIFACVYFCVWEVEGKLRFVTLGLRACMQTMKPQEPEAAGRLTDRVKKRKFDALFPSLPEPMKEAWEEVPPMLWCSQDTRWDRWVPSWHPRFMEHPPTHGLTCCCVYPKRRRRKLWLQTLWNIAAENVSLNWSTSTSTETRSQIRISNLSCVLSLQNAWCSIHLCC